MELKLGLSRDQLKRYSRKCKVCGAPIYAYYKSQLKRFCSNSCSSKHRWSKDYSKRKLYVEYKCPNCGELVYVDHADYRIKRGQNIFFCNRKCSSEYHSRLILESKEKKICKNCGKEYISKNKICCSNKCRLELWEKESAFRKENHLNKYSGREAEYMKEYVSTHREVISMQRKLRLERSTVAEKYAIKLRKEIQRCFVRCSQYENSYLENILGCSIPTFREYISGMLNNGMTMDNYGEWELDHIIPLDSAKSIEEVKRLCNFSNYQPLWARDNRSKGNKLIKKATEDV